MQKNWQTLPFRSLLLPFFFTQGFSVPHSFSSMHEKEKSVWADSCLLHKEDMLSCRAQQPSITLRCWGMSHRLSNKGIQTLLYRYEWTTKSHKKVVKYNNLKESHVTSNQASVLIISVYEIQRMEVHVK